MSFYEINKERKKEYPMPLLESIFSLLSVQLTVSMIVHIAHSEALLRLFETLYPSNLATSLRNV